MAFNNNFSGTVIFFFISFLCFGQEDSIKANQKDVLGVLKKVFVKNDTVAKSNDKLVFSLIPAPADANSNGGLVVSFVTSFYLGDDRTKTTMSSINFTPTFSISNQYIFPVRSYIYTQNDIYNFIGDYRFMLFPQPTYGIGTNNAKEPQSILDYRQFRFYQFMTRKIKGNFRLGLGIQYDNYKSINEEAESVAITDYNAYMNGDYSNEKSVGIAIQTLYDSRKNNINPTQGLYFEGNVRMNTALFGSERKWNSIYIDLRKYYSFSQTAHRVLANRAFYWSTFNGKPHYLDLPSIGWDRYGKTGRGFTKNRFRSTSLVYFESEYRTDVTRNGFLGAVAFTNLSSVTDINRSNFTEWKPAIGAGIRLKWNKKNDSNIAIDFGKSKNDWSLGFGLSENF